MHFPPSKYADRITCTKIAVQRVVLRPAFSYGSTVDCLESTGQQSPIPYMQLTVFEADNVAHLF